MLTPEPLDSIFMQDLRTAFLAQFASIFACLPGHAPAHATTSRESVEANWTARHRGDNTTDDQTIADDAVIFFGKAKGNTASGDAGITWGPAYRSGDAAPGRAGAAFVWFRRPAPSRAGIATILRSDTP